MTVRVRTVSYTHLPGLVRRVTGVELGCDGYGFDLVFGSAPDAAAVHIATRYNGLYMVYNVAAAFFAAHELGVDAAHLQPTLDAHTPAGGDVGIERGLQMRRVHEMCIRDRMSGGS